MFSPKPTLGSVAKSKCRQCARLRARKSPPYVRMRTFSDRTQRKLLLVFRKLSRYAIENRNGLEFVSMGKTSNIVSMKPDNLPFRPVSWRKTALIYIDVKQLRHTSHQHIFAEKSQRPPMQILARAYFSQPDEHLLRARHSFPSSAFSNHRAERRLFA